MSATTLRRLSEQDLAQLYLQTEAPLRLDDLLQDRADSDAARDAAQIAVHDSVSGHTPDLALIALSLCGLIIARDFPMPLKDGPCGPVLRELLVACDDNLLTVGRLWLDSVCHGIAPDPKSDKQVIASIPDRLRILASIFMELRDALDGGDNALMHSAVKTLYYQSESHADLADRFVANLTRPKKTKPAVQAATEGNAGNTPDRPAARRTPDQIPLPYDLTRPRQGAEIVSFSLFHQKRR